MTCQRPNIEEKIVMYVSCHIAPFRFRLYRKYKMGQGTVECGNLEALSHDVWLVGKRWAAPVCVDSPGTALIRKFSKDLPWNCGRAAYFQKSLQVNQYVHMYLAYLIQCVFQTWWRIWPLVQKGVAGLIPEEKLKLSFHSISQVYFLSEGVADLIPYEDKLKFRTWARLDASWA